jgi:hypothetical protein
MADVNLLLAQMQGVRAFILYKLLPQADGSLDKVPLNPYSGRLVSAHEPNEWMLPSEAAIWAEQYGSDHGVAVVISEQIVLPNGLRLFCLDLDKCRDGNSWLPHAASFCARFSGALIECSVSGNGLHVFASYRGERPDHGVKNKTYRMELYTRLRFIALTGVGMTGNALADHTSTLQGVAKEFFPPHDDLEYGDTLTEKPVVEWYGPDDDEELLRRAMRSNSGGAVFGGKAAFADLWYGNVASLSRAFPPFKNTAFDESAADQALANHLAFWTGNHGVRMERMMRASALMRSKYDRPGYLVGTINRACGSQRQWYKGSQPATTAEQTAVPHATGTTEPTDNAAVAGALLNALVSAPAPPTAQAVPAPAHVTTGAPGGFSSVRPNVGDYLTLNQQLALFEGCVYVQDMHQVMMPQGYMLSSERFDAEFSGYTFIATADGTRPARRAWDAFVHSEVHNFPKVKGTFFDPRSAPRTITVRDGWTFINSWVPIDIPRRRGDPSPFLSHLKRILPLGNDADILLAYFAACVQYPGIKFQWWPLIQGVEGNGKTILSELLERAVGSRYAHWPKASEVGSRFNAPFYGKILILVEDVKISEARDSLWETLKPMITGRKLEIESKGVDKVTREVSFNGVLNTNHKNGIRKTRNDRRICPFFCAQQHESDLARDGLTEDYFNWLREWIRIEGGPVVTDYLMTYEIPEQWNPATRAIRAPKTTATEEAITAGLGSVEQEVLEAIQQSMPGFRGGWVSSSALDLLLSRMGKASTIPRNKRRDLLESLGYTLHPALPDGRTPVADTDGSRPRLYVRGEAQGAQETNPSTVIQWYQWAQGQAAR